MRALIVDVLLLFGSLLMVVSAVGVLRFRDTMARIHSLSTASGFGVVIVLLAGFTAIRGHNERSFLILAAGFQLLTSPIASHLLGRATRRVRQEAHEDPTDLA